jgi:hypothetical protein
MNPFRALLDAIRRRRLRRIAAQRLDTMLRRDGAARRLGDAGIASAGPILATYRIAPHAARKSFAAWPEPAAAWGHLEIERQRRHDRSFVLEG